MTPLQGASREPKIEEIKQSPSSRTSPRMGVRSGVGTPRRCPLAPLGSDSALLEAIIADESRLRNTMILLEASGGQNAVIVREALTAIRVLWNAVKRHL